MPQPDMTDEEQKREMSRIDWSQVTGEQGADLLMAQALGTGLREAYEALPKRPPAEKPA